MSAQGEQSVYDYIEGKPYPLGAHCRDGGVNFSVFSSSAKKMELLLFRTRQDLEPFQIIQLNKKDNFEFGFWNVFVKDLKPNTYYAYRVHKPNSNINQKVLLDPYAKGIDTSLWDINNALSTTNVDNLGTSMRGCILNISDYDWEGVEKPRIPLKETIIYEMHVKGFTNSVTSEVKNPGTYLSIIEKIPYLKELGITAVELMPIMQFDETEDNFWGYNTVGFFAPHSAYCVSLEESRQLNEFRDMVKELHRNGIEVFLDVVYNHTREGNETGPIINFKGFDNDLYYSMSPDGKYNNYSGCGNSLSCNHPIVEKLILESLEFWATVMQVDGFRFDLGTILTLDTHGNILEYPPVLWEIELRETLVDCKLIAEPWGGDGEGRLYQMGDIHGFRWSQWNGKYRDCIRNFVRGTPGIIGEVATRISGSPDLYEKSNHLPISSINFVTCHDGFTLNDLVSYTNKCQLSRNYGIEGPTNDLKIDNLRLRQVKNFIAILLLSKGVPMILAGDEMRRTQGGIANGYQLDNELGWLDWELLKQNEELFNFLKKMVKLRKQTFFLQTKHFYTGTISGKHTRELNDISWHGVELDKPDWYDPSAKTLAFTIAGVSSEMVSDFSSYGEPEKFKDEDVHVMMNMGEEPVVFQIPQINGRIWFVYTDSFEKHNLEDIFYSEDAYLVKPKSIVILVSKESD